MITEATSPMTVSAESTTKRSETSTTESKITQTTELPITTTESQTTISTKVTYPSIFMYLTYTNKLLAMHIWELHFWLW